MIVVTVFLSFFEPNGNTFGSKLKGKLSPRSYLIQCERKWKHSSLSRRIESSAENVDACEKHENGVPK